MSDYVVRVEPGRGENGENAFHLIVVLPHPLHLSVPLSATAATEATVVSACCHAQAAIITPDWVMCNRCEHTLPFIPSPFLPGTFDGGIDLNPRRVHELLEAVEEPLLAAVAVDGLVRYVKQTSRVFSAGRDLAFPARWTYFRLLSSWYGSTDVLAPFSPPDQADLASLKIQAGSLAPSW